MARTAGTLATMLTAALTAAVCLTAGAASGEPGRCIRELPSKRTEHWSYHIVSGQRCWYPDSERATTGRKIRVERRERPQERPQESAARSARPKIRPSTPASAAESEPRATSALAAIWNEWVAPSPKVDPPNLRPAAVENRPEASAPFAEVWDNRIAARGLSGSIAVRAAPTEDEWRGLPPAPQQANSQASAATGDLSAVMLWFALGFCVLALPLFGMNASKTLQQLCSVVLEKLIVKKQQAHRWRRSKHRHPEMYSARRAAGQNVTKASLSWAKRETCRPEGTAGRDVGRLPVA